MVLVRAIADAEERHYLANGEYSKEFVNLDISFDGLKKKTDSNQNFTIGLFLSKTA